MKTYCIITLMALGLFLSCGGSPEITGMSETNAIEENVKSENEDDGKKSNWDSNLTSCPKCGKRYNKKTWGELCPTCMDKKLKDDAYEQTQHLRRL